MREENGIVGEKERVGGRVVSIMYMSEIIKDHI